MNALGVKMAQALLGKADRLADSNDHEEAVAIYEKVIKRFGKSKAPKLQELVARALFDKASALMSLNRLEEALEALDQFVKSSQLDRADADEQNKLAWAMYFKGCVLSHLDRHEEAIAVIDELVEVFDPAAEESLQRLVARALNLKGMEVAWCIGLRESCALHAQIVERFGMARDPGLQEEAARALLRVALNLQGGFLLKSFEDSDGGHNKGFDTVLSLKELERMSCRSTPSEADYQAAVISAFDEVNVRFGDSVHPGVRKVVAEAMVDKGKYLSSLERHAEAIEVYDGLIQRWMNGTEPAVSAVLAKAMVNKAGVLHKLERHAEAIEVYDGLIERWMNETEPAMCELVASAMVSEAVLLRKLERNREAIAVCDKMIERFGTETGSGLRDKVNAALTCKEESVEALSQLVKEFELKWRIGLRTAVFIVETVTSKFASKIRVSCGEDTCDGKEIHEWLMLRPAPKREKILAVGGGGIAKMGSEAGSSIKVANNLEPEKILAAGGRVIVNMGPEAGTRIKIAINGPDAAAAMDALTELLSIGVRVTRCIQRGCPSPPILLCYKREENRVVIHYGCSAWHHWQVEEPLVS